MSVRIVSAKKGASHDWSNSLFNCCSAGAGPCIRAFVCPCVLFGENVAKFRKKPEDYGDACCSYCLMHSFSRNISLSFIAHAPFRDKLRESYNIDNPTGLCQFGDTCTVCLFGPCALIQERAEMEEPMTSNVTQAPRIQTMS